jgi:hypothetical protein
MMKMNSAYAFLGVFFLLFFFSACVKDTNFDQADNIVLTPIVELDLLYFDLPAITFFDTATSIPVLTVRDTTDLPFLNDAEIRNNLKRAVFSFKVGNSIQREFQVDFEFLDDQNQVTSTIQIPVAQGTVSNPVITEYTENFEGQELINLTGAGKVAVSVTIASSNANLDGSIKLQSKTTYYLEL